MTDPKACKYGDPYCPCQDGGQCHYEGVNPMNLTITDPAPCPFCGHSGLSFAEGSTFRWLAYSCAACGTGNETRVQTLGEGTPTQWRTQAEAEAVAEWNKRTPPAEPHVEDDRARFDAWWESVGNPNAFVGDTTVYSIALRAFQAALAAERAKPCFGAGNPDRNYTATGGYLNQSEHADWLARATQCWCASCDRLTNCGLRSKMSICPQCGDKRCPRAENHANDCGTTLPPDSLAGSVSPPAA